MFFQSNSEHWKSTCLPASTDTAPASEQVAERKALRWSNELKPLQLKQALGIKET